MSDIRPEVTERLTAFLCERTAWGDAKYGTPLLPFDGRNTLMDALEEVTDLAQYIMKRVMENEAIADLFRTAAQSLDYRLPGSGDLGKRLLQMEALLRADVKRSVPVGGV